MEPREGRTWVGSRSPRPRTAGDGTVGRSGPHPSRSVRTPWRVAGRCGGAADGERHPRRRASPAWRLARVLAPLLLSAAPLQAQVLQGRVLSSPDDQPIPQAGVSLVDSLGNVLRTALTSGSGVFRMNVGAEAGAVHVQAQALGFLTFFDGPVPMGAGDPVEIVIRLQPRPFSLDSLTVTVERQSVWLDYTGFYDRDAMGQGYHMDRNRIQDRVWARTLADLLRAVPGVTVDNVGGVRLRGIASPGGCPYGVYLDGALVVSPTFPDDGWAVHLIRPEEVDGIEVYRRPGEVPIQYSGSGACGVILIWSRR